MNGLNEQHSTQKMERGEDNTQNCQVSRDEYLIKSRVKSFCLFCRVGFAFFQSGDATSVERCYIFFSFFAGDSLEWSI